MEDERDYRKNVHQANFEQPFFALRWFAVFIVDAKNISSSLDYSGYKDNEYKYQTLSKQFTTKLQTVVNYSM